MTRTLASLLIAGGMMLLNTASASAWTCMAAGLGRSATGHGFDIEIARMYALARCERRTGGPCAILWCRL